MNCNVMNYNDDALQGLMKGADILHSMLDDLTRSIFCLPDFKAASKLKMMSKRIENDSNDVYELMRDIYNYAVDVSCDADEFDEDEYFDEDVSQGGELQELLTCSALYFHPAAPFQFRRIFISTRIRTEMTRR